MWYSCSHLQQEFFFNIIMPVVQSWCSTQHSLQIVGIKILASQWRRGRQIWNTSTSNWYNSPIRRFCCTSKIAANYWRTCYCNPTKTKFENPQVLHSLTACLCWFQTSERFALLSSWCLFSRHAVELTTQQMQLFKRQERGNLSVKRRTCFLFSK